MYEITYALLFVMILFGIEGAIIDSFIKEKQDTFYNIVKKKMIDLYNKLNIFDRILFILISFICLSISVILYKITFLISKYVIKLLRFLFFKR